MFKKIIVLIISSLVLLLSCNTTEPPPSTPPPPVTEDTITVTIEDVTHKSIVFTIQTTKNNPQSAIEVLRRINNADTIIAEFAVTVGDTTINDNNDGQGLQLDTEYSYYAVRKDITGVRKDTSNIATERTLAATNFNYTWQEFAIGEWNSVLNDVWGTDENNVYAVGGVRLNDTVYGVIKWNGTEWLPEKKMGVFRQYLVFPIQTFGLLEVAYFITTVLNGRITPLGIQL